MTLALLLLKLLGFILLTPSVWWQQQLYVYPTNCLPLPAYIKDTYLATSSPTSTIPDEHN